MVCTQSISGVLSCLLSAILFGYIGKSSLSPQVMGVAYVIALSSCCSAMFGVYDTVTGNCTDDKK